ncbi:7 transmembrane sweet-taste receptor of 3 GCPR-domain-containing protein [Chlamydoabsidia padenii]|nr:7 transmembrane sweet-taste receptor of 3 GCPR-domain-containing protein [Chlamydoabsidia padenii]
MYLNPGYSTPLSIVLVTVSGIGILLSLISICLVLVYRKRNVFQTSNTLFYILELVGFILCYISILFFAGDRSRLTCIVVPAVFNLGYSMVMGNLIAKNYRIYHVFYNIFITHTEIHAKQLLKVSVGILLLEMTVLSFWLCLCNPQVIAIPVSTNAYYKACSYDGTSHWFFVVLLALIAGCELVFALFLALSTRLIGKSYSKYTEYKQIGLCIYNVFFSALIGGIVFFLPSIDYYTQHYLTATMIVWATTFCLFALFLPKFIQLCKPGQNGYPVKSKNSDLPGRQQTISSSSSKHGSTTSVMNNNLQKEQQQQQQQQTFGELLSMNGVLNGKDVRQSPYRNSNNNTYHYQQKQYHHQQYQLQHRQLYHRVHTAIERTKTSSTRPKKQVKRQKGQVLDSYEAQMPIRRVLKYLPFVSSWDMQQIILMPGASYFSHFSENTGKGNVFGYSHASVESATKGAYVLKLHGLHFYDIMVQVANEEDLQQWCNWFNSKPSLTLQPQGKHQQHSFLTKSSDGVNTITSAINKAISTQHQPNIDSGMTMRHLLAMEEEDDGDKRQASCITLATLGSHTSPENNNGGAMTLLSTDEHATLHNPPLYHPTFYHLDTPDSEDRTIVGTPSRTDDDVIMMHHL